MELPGKTLNRLAGKKVFYGYYEAVGIYDLKTHKQYSIDEFRGQKSLVVCGIARPFSFLKILEEHSIDIKNKFIFRDHKDYTIKEVQEIRKKFYDSNSFSVLTTQKDAVKLNNFSKEFDDIDIFYVKIELKIEDEEKFRSELLQVFN
jgi:tetraacyldisaccharide 4'-kinase